MIANKLLVLCGTEAEDAESLVLARAVGTRIACRSCSVPIVMDWNMMVRSHPRLSSLAF